MIDPPNDPDLKLLPHRIDWLSKHDPSRPYAKYPKDANDLSAGFETITFSNFAAAINGTARWLSIHLGPNDRYFAYCGRSDLRWSLLLVAGIKIGRAMVHVSPWIRTEGIIDLLEACGCTVILCDGNPSSDAVASISLPDIYSVRLYMRVLTVPSLLELFRNSMAPTASFPYNETWDEAADRRVAIFHTSGNQDSPKPIVWSNRTIAIWYSMLELARRDPSAMIPDVVDKTIFMALMPAHVEGQSFQLFMPVFLRNTIVLRHPSQTLDPETVRQIMLRTSCTGIAASPGHIAQFAGFPRALALLRALETVIVIGTGLSTECSELLCRPGLTVQTFYGNNEIFPLVQQQSSCHDPSSISFHQVSGATFELHNANNYELVIRQDDTCIELQGAFQAWPYFGTYATGDLFCPHPTLLSRWIYQGRKDDKIVLAHGEVMQVSRMERAVGAHPLVKSALVYGESRPRPLLVIEPWSDVMTSIKSEDDRDSFLNEIWPDVEVANAGCPSIGRLCRQLTLVMNMPVVKTRQHTIDRKLTLLMLNDQVERLYSTYEKSDQPVELEDTDEKIAPESRTRSDDLRDHLRRFHAFREVNAFQW